jgi:predicted lipoprotein with Yx(FWY)xxD motif
MIGGVGKVAPRSVSLWAVDSDERKAMFGSEPVEVEQSQRPQHASGPPTRLAAVALALTVALVAAALASAAATLTVGSASNQTLNEQLLVNGQGRTLYALSPETTAHLLCKSSECLQNWPPLTVRSRATKLTGGAGVHGHLGILRRSNGLLQVTLRGLPLYRYAGDHARGDAHGEDIKSFGGTWHAVTAAGKPSSTVPPTPTAPAPTSTAPAPTPAMPAPTPTTPAPSPTPPYGY